MRKIVLISLLFILFGCNPKEKNEVVKKSKEEKLLEVQEWIAETLRVPEAKYLSKKWVYDTYDLLELDLNDEKAVYEWLRKESLSEGCYSYAESLMPNDEVSYRFHHDVESSRAYHLKLYKKILGKQYKKRLRINKLYYLRSNNDFKKYPYQLFPDKYCELPHEYLSAVLVKYYRDYRNFTKDKIAKFMSRGELEVKERWRLIYDSYDE
ncbi:hypothetical protein ABMA77_10270 [Halobacteriovorax sp. RZ-1]|uniref:hypothetical protein n=1 Tax=unclassified Halobacteriovorax TaxID=2639665 RepID=UPI00371A6443